jgi:hypothetical protein
VPGRFGTSSVGAVAVAVEGVRAAVANDGADTIVELGAACPFTGCGACILVEDGAEDTAEPGVTGS